MTDANVVPIQRTRSGRFATALKVPRGLVAQLRARFVNRGPNSEAIRLREMFAPATPPPGVLPKDFKFDDGEVKLALDAQVQQWAQDQQQIVVSPWLAGAAQAGSFAEGQLWLGYAYLSELAVRPEYRAAVGTIAEEMTREWIEVKAKSDDEDKSARIAELVDYMDKELHAGTHVQKLIEHDGYFGRGHLYLDTGDTDDLEELKKPIGDGRDEMSAAKVGPKKPLRGLINVEPVWTYPTRYDSVNPLKPDWYRPVTWFVMGTEIHESRLLTLIGREVPDLLKPAYSFGGLSLTQIGKPYVDNWLRTRQSVADIISAFSVMVLSTDLASTLQNGGQELFERLDLFNLLRNNMAVMALNKDTEDFKNVSAPLGTLDALQAQTQEHCLPGDTLIETDRGLVPIRDVTVRDRVMTRGGWAPLAWAGITGYSTNLVEVSTVLSTLRATEWHPIYLPSTHGFAPAGSVRVGDHLLEAATWRTSMVSQPCGVAGGGESPRRVTVAMCVVAASCIELFGRLTTALFQRGSTCITSMAIGPTIDCQTWNSRRLPSTPSSTCVVGDWGSTNIPWSARSAWSAARSSWRATRRLSTAVSGATLRPGCTGPANSTVTRATRLLASNVARFFTWLRYQSEGCTAARSAPTVLTIAGITSVRRIEVSHQPVYNLEVVRGYLPEFFANGILVHNCAAIWRIPLVKYLGLQPAGLNASSEGEIRSFYDTTKAHQEAKIRPVVDRIFHFSQLSLWGKVDPDLVYDFKGLWQLDEAGLAAVQKTKADTHEAYVAMGVVDAKIIRKAVAADKESPYAGLDLDAEPMPEPEAEPGEGGEEGGTEPENMVTGKSLNPPQSSRLATSITTRQANYGGAATEGFKAQDFALDDDVV